MFSLISNFGKRVMKRSMVNPNKRLKVTPNPGVRENPLQGSSAVSSQRPDLSRNGPSADLLSTRDGDRPRVPRLSQSSIELMETVEKSPNDKREYRVLKLQNGLTALLISDPGKGLREEDACHAAASDESDDDSSDESSEDGSSGEEDEEEEEKDDDRDHTAVKKKRKHGSEKLSAAALCIGVGSFSDPPDIPGLSHFLEHMVFMGSEKYPDENDFDAFLKLHGGFSNAYTDCERTVFYFDVKRENFEAALDRFAQFFICPLLQESSVDREIEAVDSEFAQAMSSDQSRLEQLLCGLARADHPMAKFMWGDRRTLKEGPIENGINLYERLREHHASMYSAHYMTLAIQSRHPLDELQSIVSDIFSEVINNKLPKPTFLNLQRPFESPAFTRLYKVIPMKKMHKVQITWSLPSLLQHYRSKPLYYIDWLVGHEGQGSILSHLKKRVWALELASASGNGESGLEHNSMHAEFQVTVSLTESGMNNIYEVITCVFEYLVMLRRIGPQKRIYDEIKTIEDNIFAWKEQIDPVDYVDDMCVNMQRFPCKEYITGELILTEYNPQLIESCLQELTPQRANIMLISKRFAEECDQTEEWFKTQYSVEDIPEEWLERWSDLDARPIFHLPASNEYIASDFSILSAEADLPRFPHLLAETNQSKLWYKKDDKFNVPKAYIFFYINNRNIIRNPRVAATADLYVSALLHNLSEVAYAARIAQLGYKVRVAESGLLIKCYGFNHKIQNLFRSIVDHMAEFSLNEDLFVAIKKEVQRVYHNYYLKPSQLASELRLALLQHDYWTMLDRQNVLAEVSLADVIHFSQETLPKGCFVEGLVQGNLSPQESLALEAHLMERLKFSAAPIAPIVVTEIPKGEKILCVESFNRHDENSYIVNYYQHGPVSLRQYTMHSLLMMKMDEPCFDMLRTREQLGYEVFNSLRNTNGILGSIIAIRSQSNKHSLHMLNEKIESFLGEFSTMVENMTQAEFDAQVSSLVTLKQCEDSNLKEEVERNWSEIAGSTYTFDVLEREVNELLNFSLEDFRSWSREVLPSGGRCRKLSIQVQGNPEAAVCHLEAQSEEDSTDSIEESQANCNSENDPVMERPELTYLCPDDRYIQNMSRFKAGQPKFPPSKIV